MRCKMTQRSERQSILAEQEALFLADQTADLLAQLKECRTTVREISGSSHRPD